MEIIYRSARRQDARELLVHIHKVGEQTDNLSFSGEEFDISEEREAKFIERFEKNKNDIMLVAEIDGRIIGNAALEANRIKRYKHRADLSVTVLKEYWGQGIGSHLMEMLISFARESELEVISLEARADNERAIALYEKFGFEKIGIYKNFFKIENEHYDAILMQLCLK